MLQDLGADELSECVQDFYQNMSDRLLSHFKGKRLHLTFTDHLEKTSNTAFSVCVPVCVCVCVMSFFLGSSEKVERVMDQVEKYIMTRLYKSVFCPETTDDEKKDLTTQHRIR